MVLRLISCSPRRRVRLVTVAGGLKAPSNPVEPDFASASLTPATGARTTRLHRTQKAPIILHAADRSRGSSRPAIALRALRPRVHRIPPRARDDARSPLWWDETVRDMPLIWVGREGKHFCRRDWTGQISLISFNNSVRRRNRQCEPKGRANARPRTGSAKQSSGRAGLGTSG